MKLRILPVEFHDERGFSLKLLPWDEYDYVLNLKAFGRDFGIGIDK